MITIGILKVVYAVLWLITTPIRALSPVTLSGSFGSAITSAMGYVSALNGFVPLAVIFTSLGIVLTFEGGVIAYKTIMWIVRRVPGQG